MLRHIEMQGAVAIMHDDNKDMQHSQLNRGRISFFVYQITFSAN